MTKGFWHEIVDGGSKPYWNNTLSFKIDRGMEDLQIRIYSKNTLRDDDLLGECLWVTFVNSLPFEIVCMFWPIHGSYSQTLVAMIFFTKYGGIKYAIGKEWASLGDCDMLLALNYKQCWLKVVRNSKSFLASFNLLDAQPTIDTRYINLPQMSGLIWWSPCFSRISFAQVFRGGHEVPVTSYKVTRSGKHYGEVRLGLAFYAKRVG